MREGFARINKEKNAIETQGDALKNKLSECSEEARSLSGRIEERDGEIRKISAENEEARKSYEGTRAAKDLLVAELLEKEKGAGKRTQALMTRAQDCEDSLDKAQKDGTARNAALSDREKEIADLKIKLAGTPDMDKLRTERDMLSGRMERLAEEKRTIDQTRAARFTTLADSLPKGTPPVDASILGSAILRVRLDDKGLFDATGGLLSEAGRKVMSEVGAAAIDLPYASFLASASTSKGTDELRDLLAAASKIPPAGIVTVVREKENGAEVLLIAP